MTELTAERARELFYYDPETGLLLWKMGGKGIPAHKSLVAGHVNNGGYRYIRVAKRLYLAHRIVWLYMHGSWPEGDIDHINGERADNRSRNLRSVSRSVNNENRVVASADNKSTGLIGAHYHKYSGKFTSQIVVREQKFYLGYFDTAEEAHDAYMTAKAELHSGYIPRPRHADDYPI